MQEHPGVKLLAIVPDHVLGGKVAEAEKGSPRYIESGLAQAGILRRQIIAVFQAESIRKASRAYRVVTAIEIVVGVAEGARLPKAGIIPRRPAGQIELALAGAEPAIAAVGHAILRPLSPQAPLAEQVEALTAPDPAIEVEIQTEVRVV